MGLCSLCRCLPVCLAAWCTYASASVHQRTDVKPLLPDPFTHGRKVEGKGVMLVWFHSFYRTSDVIGRAQSLLHCCMFRDADFALLTIPTFTDEKDERRRTNILFPSSSPSLLPASLSLSFSSFPLFYFFSLQHSLIR